MIYKIDNRPNRNRKRNIALSVVCVIAILVTGVHMLNPHLIDQSIHNTGTDIVNTATKYGVLEQATPDAPLVNTQWANSFFSYVNAERIKEKLSPMTFDPTVNNIAESRFNAMITHPTISHYGFNLSGISELVFYPDGTTPQNYEMKIQYENPFHWQALDSTGTYDYGYYISQGPVISILGNCPMTEITGSINVTKFFEDEGCKTEVQQGTWFVIEIQSE